MRFKPKLTLFNVFYSTTFSLLFFLLVILLLITPGDAIYQIVKQSRPSYQIVVIAVCYFLTLIIALAIYGSRLYTVRALDIPREYVPIKKNHLPKRRVYARIRAGLGRSAIIAYETRPKPKPKENVVGRGRGREEERERESGFRAVWGEINHCGRSPPDSEDLPNVEYLPIIRGLPNLIEEKALSLGLQRQYLRQGGHRHGRGQVRVQGQDDRYYDSENYSETNYPHPQLLSRLPQMSLRAYISYLQKLGYIDRPVGEVFIRDYERARFYSADLNGVEEEEFRKLMKVFALLLRRMDELGQEQQQQQQQEQLQRNVSSGPEYSSVDYGETSEGGEEAGVIGPRSNNFEWEGVRGGEGGEGRGRLGEDLRRIFTQSTTRSDSSAEFPQRRRNDEAFEMEYMIPPHSRMRQRPSFGTFG